MGYFNYLEIDKKISLEGSRDIFCILFKYQSFEEV